MNGETSTNKALNTTAVFNLYFPNNFQKSQVTIGTTTGLAGRLTGENRPRFTVHDARAHFGPLTRDNAGRVFRNHGFCCLHHETKVQDWNENHNQRESDIRNMYAPEIEEMIRNVLLAEYHVVEVVCLNAVGRRGPGSKKNQLYANGVHQDFGQTLEDYKNNLVINDDNNNNCGDNNNKTRAKQTSVARFYQKFQHPAVHGIMTLNFWRPVIETILSTPLALCDPASVRIPDVVQTLKEQKGNIQMALKYNPQHKWYYYPHMTKDEVLVFKTLEIWKTDSKDRDQIPVRGAFHSAFEDPNTPMGAPPRTSTEYRVTVFVGQRR
jgi:hypothetical protein